MQHETDKRLGLTSPTARADKAIRSRRSQVETVRAEYEQYQTMAQHKRKFKARRTGEIASIEERLLSIRCKHEQLISEVAQREANLQCLLALDFASHEEALQTLLLMNAILLNTSVRDCCADLLEDEDMQLQALQTHLKAVLTGTVAAPCLNTQRQQKTHFGEADDSNSSLDSCDSKDEMAVATVPELVVFAENVEDVDGDLEALEALEHIEKSLRHFQL
jgi:hypothetical protein